MSKLFKTWSVDQLMLLPPSIQELVPAGHLAHFVRDTVRDSLDLSAILKTYTEERGFPPYHPIMMTALLLYAYCQGLYASRRIAKACEERVDFMALTALQRPDFRTISDFRKRHLTALGGLFTQVLKLCQAAGLVQLGHVALDGTKLKANASKHKAMSYGRMQKTEAELAATVQGWLQKAETLDAREDAEVGRDRRGDELPTWVADKQARLDKIRQAKAALEADAKAEATHPSPVAASPQRGRPPTRPPGVPHEKAQRNFTDPESRIMKTAEGVVQGYNAQAAVDAASQIIVAQHVTPAPNDQQQLVSLLAQIKANTGRQAREVSADAGYCSEANLRELRRRHISGYVATGRQHHGQAAATGHCPAPAGARTRAMRLKLRRGGYRSRYRLRKQTVEPVFGQIKQARGFRQVLLRGLSNVAQEWSLVCLAHNFLKLAKALA
ncbi:MAG: IS1182 family transposase [Nitrospira sp. CG24D]|jgi:transposase|nr:IS1182 family transposase [Nitrospira sp.]THJ21372.1 MAG: IS1182 family transposase [Nitrospira sp. CG24D]